MSGCIRYIMPTTVKQFGTINEIVERLNQNIQISGLCSSSQILELSLIPPTPDYIYLHFAGHIMTGCFWCVESTIQNEFTCYANYESWKETTFARGDLRTKYRSEYFFIGRWIIAFHFAAPHKNPQICKNIVRGWRKRTQNPDLRG